MTERWDKLLDDVFQHYKIDDNNPIVFLFIYIRDINLLFVSLSIFIKSADILITFLYANLFKMKSKFDYPIKNN